MTDLSATPEIPDKEPTDTQRMEALAAGLARIILYENPDDKKRRCKIEAAPPKGKRAGVSVAFLRMLADGLIPPKLPSRTSESVPREELTK